MTSYSLNRDPVGEASLSTALFIVYRKALACDADAGACESLFITPRCTSTIAAIADMLRVTNSCSVVDSVVFVMKIISVRKAARKKSLRFYCCSFSFYSLIDELAEPPAAKSITAEPLMH